MMMRLTDLADLAELQDADLLPDLADLAELQDADLLPDLADLAELQDADWLPWAVNHHLQSSGCPEWMRLALGVLGPSAPGSPSADDHKAP
jgi:hypothetical protein